MSQPIIDVQNLSKRYRLGRIGATTLRDDMARVWSRLRGRAPSSDTGDFWALRDVSFSVQPGEVLGVIGRNGAGKSTLLKVLSRITEPTGGRAILRGRVASLLEVGTGFHPDLTGRENVFLNGAILGMKRHEVAARFDEIVAFSEISKFIDTPVKHYSSGMRVRLAFAVAAHLDSEVLIVDEVLAVGDHTFQQKCMGKMENLTGGGRTILLVSHQLPVIQTLCTRCLYLEEGRVKATGETAKLVSLYYESGEDVATRYQNPLKPDQVGVTHACLQTTAPNGGHPFTAPLTLCVDVQGWDRLTKPALAYQFKLDGSAGVLHGWVDENMFETVSGNHIRLTASFPKLRLLPGNYTLSLHLSAEGGRQKLEQLNNVLGLTVAAAPPQGYAQAWRTANGTYVEDVVWTATPL